MKRKYSTLVNLGKRIAKYRRDAGYSQRTLAEEIKVSHRMVAYYESQDGRPPVDILVRIANALDVSTDLLLGIETNEKKKTRPHNRRLFSRLKQIEKLPSRDRETVLKMIEGLVIKNTMTQKS